MVSDGRARDRLYATPRRGVRRLECLKAAAAILIVAERQTAGQARSVQQIRRVAHTAARGAAGASVVVGVRRVASDVTGGGDNGVGRGCRGSDRQDAHCEREAPQKKYAKHMAILAPRGPPLREAVRISAGRD